MGATILTPPVHQVIPTTTITTIAIAIALDSISTTGRGTTEGATTTEEGIDEDTIANIGDTVIAEENTEDMEEEQDVEVDANLK